MGHYIYSIGVIYRRFHAKISTKSTYSDQNFLATLDNKRLIYSDPDSQFDCSGTFNDQKIVTNRSGGAPSQFEFFFSFFTLFS